MSICLYVCVSLLMTAAAGAKASTGRYSVSDRTKPKVLLIGSSQCLPEATGPNFNAQLDKKVGLDVITSCHSGSWIASPWIASPLDKRPTRPEDAVMVVHEECKKHKPSVVVLFHGANDVYKNEYSDSVTAGDYLGTLDLLKQEPRLFVKEARAACGADTKIVLAQGVVHTKTGTAFTTLRDAMQQTADSTAGVTFADMGSWEEIQTQKDQYCASTTMMVAVKHKGDLCDDVHFCKFQPNKNCALLDNITTKLANSIKKVARLS